MPHLAPLLLLLPPLAVPQDLGARVDALFARWDRPDSPGAAVAVVERGAIVFADGYGSAQLEYEVPIAPETIFHVASVSKQLTAFAVCLLEADGALSLDDPIRKHVPEVPEVGREITLRHLLHHTSGLRDQWESLAIAGWRLDDVITTEHVLTFVAHQRELNFAPGAEHLYCNTGYTLLAEAVARVSGQSFPDFCRERIFEPLGMRRTHFHDDHERVVPGRAYSYRRAGGSWENAVLSYANAGATSLFTTAYDLLRWLRNLSSGAVGGPVVQARMRERYVLADGTEGDYALGLMLGEHRGQPTVGHAGGDAGFRAHVVWFPERELGVAVLANAGDLFAPELALAVADLVLRPAEPAGGGPDADGGGAVGESRATADPEDPEDGAGAEEPPAGDEPLAPAIELDASTLARYAGRYRHAGGFVVRVELREGALRFRTDSWYRGIPIAEDAFRFEETPAIARFELGADGTAAAFEITDGQQVLRLERFEPPPVADLAAFAGRYWSEELGTFYDVGLDDGELVARHRRHGVIALEHQGDDAFRGDRWFFGRIEFTRADDGAVAGFLLQGERVRNLRFDRN